MDILPFLQKLLRETSGLRLSAHCRGLAVEVTVHENQQIVYGTLSERISNINLMGGVGTLALNVHFDLDAAVAFAAKGLGKSEDEIDDALAIDFMREFSNLHAGFLRGLFESTGIEFGMSLPFVTASEAGTPSGSGQVPMIRDVWTLSHGDLQLHCTSEIELAKPAAVEKVEPALAASLTKEHEKMVNGDIGGDLEFFI